MFYEQILCYCSQMWKLVRKKIY